MLAGLVLLSIGLVLFLLWRGTNDDIYKYFSALFAVLGVLVLLCVGMFRLGQQSILIDQKLEQQKIEQQALIEELNLTPEQVKLIRK